MNIKKLAQLMLIIAALLTMASACSKNDDEPSGQSSTVDNSNGDWVDLGLPSGLLWARCNVGATRPEEYGDYFAWGETRSKSVYNWKTYAYGNHWDELTKYSTDASLGYNGFTDGLTILQASDDAATVALGNGTRTPTYDEWQELWNNCTSEWSTKNGVLGRYFTGRNGNTIFLPATGFRRDSDLYDAGDNGFYWSRSLCKDSPCYAWTFHFISVGATSRSVNGREDGLPVRPVRSVH